MVKTKQDGNARGTRRQFDADEALEVCMNLFWRHGFEATSMASLLDATGLTAPSLYSAFGNKEQLFLKAVERYAKTIGEDVNRGLDEERPAKDAIEKLLYAAAKEYSSPRHPAGCLLFTGSIGCSPESASIEVEIRKMRMAAEKRIAKRLAIAQKNGELTETTSASELAKYFYTVMQGLSLQAIDGVSKVQLNATIANAMRAWPLSE